MKRASIMALSMSVLLTAVMSGCSGSEGSQSARAKRRMTVRNRRSQLR